MREPKFLFKVGQEVVKSTGDYTFSGEVRMRGRKISGVIRYVVEDDRGVLFIFRGDQLEAGRKRVHGNAGSRCGSAKLDDAEVRLIRWMLGKGITITELGKAFNVSRQTIGDIRDGKTWKEVAHKY